MLTKKVKMYGGYIDSLRTIPEFILIDIASRIVNNMCSMFNFWEGVKN
jgi:hypothetical protein